MLNLAGKWFAHFSLCFVGQVFILTVYEFQKINKQNRIAAKKQIR